MYCTVGILTAILLGVAEVKEDQVGRKISYEFKNHTGPTAGIVPEKCLHCICKVESRCKPIGCRMDVGSLSCGYYQIKFPYWKDCYKPKPSGGCSSDTDCWKKCANDMACASKCVNSYMSRYDRQPGCKADCESFARLHNGGPMGCTNPRTLGYWKKVKACLDGQNDTRLEFQEYLEIKSRHIKL